MNEFVLSKCYEIINFFLLKLKIENLRLKIERYNKSIQAFNYVFL
jgi:hypothetical protein